MCVPFSTGSASLPRTERDAQRQHDWSALRFWCNEVLHLDGVRPAAEGGQLERLVEQVKRTDEATYGRLLLAALDHQMPQNVTPRDCIPLCFTLPPGSVGLPLCLGGVRLQVVEMPIDAA